MKICLAIVLCFGAAAAQQCGAGFRRNRIVGGDESGEHAWPWQASLHSTSWFGSGHICGASLIAPGWVVTAAHCVEGGSASQYRVVLGEHSQTHDSGREIRINVARIFMHPDYNGNANGFPNDIALLKLSTNVVLNEVINLVCLPVAGETFEKGDECWITGWGNTQGTGDDDVLNELKIDITDRAECTLKWGADYIRDSHICVGNGNIGACNGDSGGPLVCKKPGGSRWILAGATSWGRSGCQTAGYPNVYTRIASFIPWVENIMETN